MSPFYPPWNGRGTMPFYPSGNPNVFVPPQPFQPQPPFWPGQPALHPIPWVPPPPNDPNNVGPDLGPLEFKSKQYPTLNAILAADSTLLRFNVTNKPSREILTSTYYAYRHVPANSTPVDMMRLISKKFPWTIDIPSQHDITCEMVWDALWAALQEPLADSEWGLFCHIDQRREAVLKAYRKRMEGNSNNGDKRLKRCDFLGEGVWFKGLERNEDFQKLRLLPGSKPCSETWMVLLDSK